MAIIINRNGETIFGQYSKGDVVLNLPPHQENLLLEMGQAVRLEHEDIAIVLAGGDSGVGLSATQTISAAGVGASIPSLSAARVGLRFGGVVGTVYTAVVQLEDGDTGAPIGVAYYPNGNPRYFDVPVGVANFKLRTTSWSDIGGSSPVDSIDATITG